VGVHGSPGSLRALRRGVAEARAHDAELVSVLAWRPVEGDMVHRPGIDRYLRELRECSAWQRLTKSWDDAFGGVPPDIDARPVVVRAPAGPALVDIAADGEGDLLVVGAGRPNRLRRALIRSVPRYCAARACCPVLVVPPSPLTRERTLTRP
jgi:nucleotide-binding universal stress UspA family protein